MTWMVGRCKRGGSQVMRRAGREIVYVYFFSSSFLSWLVVQLVGVDRIIYSFFFVSSVGQSSLVSLLSSG